MIILGAGARALAQAIVTEVSHRDSDRGGSCVGRKAEGSSARHRDSGLGSRNIRWPPVYPYTLTSAIVTEVSHN